MTQADCTLRMIDLFPQAVISNLRSQFGAAFDQLEYEERVALALAARGDAEPRKAMHGFLSAFS